LVITPDDAGRYRIAEDSLAAARRRYNTVPRRGFVGIDTGRDGLLSAPIFLCLQHKKKGAGAMTGAEFTFEDFIRIWVRVALVLVFVEAYLTVNKIWIRKHERIVSESISVSAQLLALATGVPFVALYVLEGAYEGAIGDGVLIFVNLILVMIGIGFWVEGGRRQGFWSNLRRALSLEKTEASTLLQELFRPQSARRVIRILHGLAMIDEEMDDRELRFIRTFADRWGIDLDAVLREQATRGDRPEASLSALREEMAGYLATTPPLEQARQLKDVLASLVQIDDRISDREQLMMEELGGMIQDYVGGTSSAGFHVFIAPQSTEQETAVVETMPNMKKERRLGGEVFRVGQYHSRDYARMVCSWYRDAGHLTIMERDGETAATASPAAEMT
jgi:hypothetical protein